MRMKVMLMLTIVLPACLASVGCIEKEVDHTLYLDPDGAVTWVVLEREIRSTSKDPRERAEEEQEVLDLWAKNEHPMAIALGELHPLSLDCQLVRAERPFMIVTSARFPQVDDALQGLYGEMGVRNEATLERSAEKTRMEWKLWTGEIDDEEVEVFEASLTEELKFVLTRGRFLEAEGFEISSDGSVAVIEFDEEIAADESEILTLSLTWTAQEETD